MTKKAWALAGGAIAVAVILAVAFVVVVATDDDDPQEAPPRAGIPFAGGGVDLSAMDDFRDCLSDHGVQPPDPSEGPQINRTPRKMREAFDACRDLLPAPPNGERSFGLPVPQN
jgi:hypothetical protein